MPIFKFTLRLFVDVLFPHVTNELSISVQTDVCQILSLVIKSFRTQQVLGILVS